MHILMLVVFGFVLLASFYGVGRLTGRTLGSLLPIYLAAWFVVSAVNMWIGVTQAGYSIAAEALFVLPIFGIPALAAVVLARRA